MWRRRRSKSQKNALKIFVDGATDIGKVRSHNEDTYRVLDGEESPSGADAVLLVADGMGGHAAGDVASRMARDRVVELLYGNEAAELDDAAFLSFLRQCLKTVNADVCHAAQDPGRSGMGTTCTLAVVRKTTLFIAHIGDSRAYLFRDGILSQITTDHSWVEERVTEGLLTKEAARVHPNRNVITRAIGIEPEAEIDTEMKALARGDLVLVASDGLTAMVADEDIEQILQTHRTRSICQTLITAAIRSGGQDNVTVAIACVRTPSERRTRLSSQETMQVTQKRSVVGALIRRIFTRR